MRDGWYCIVMRSPADLIRSPLRRVTACMALAATLFAAGAPALHALVHAAGASHRATGSHHQTAHAATSAVTGEHSHEVDHPPGLHDEAVLLRGAPLDFVFIAPIPVAVLNLLPATERLVVRPAARGWTSRAPPPGDPARAPPLV